MALAALLAGAGAAMAQPTTTWVAREYESGVNGADMGRDIAVWKDTAPEPDVMYVYVTGTKRLSSTVSQIATYKYKVVDNNPPALQASHLFPPTATAQGLSGGMAIDIDPSTGDVFVTGESKIKADGSYGSNLNYVTIKYDFDLSPHDDWAAGGGPAQGVRVYNGPGNGDDQPVDVRVDVNGYCYVTGTSLGDGTDRDLATLKYGPDGDLDATSWPILTTPTFSVAHPVGGVRRYNFAEQDNADTAVELGLTYIYDESEDTYYANVYVLGTSYGGTDTKRDIVLVKYASPNGTEDEAHDGFVKRYDGPPNEEDVATGLDLPLDDRNSSAVSRGPTRTAPDLRKPWRAGREAVWARTPPGSCARSSMPRCAAS